MRDPVTDLGTRGRAIFVAVLLFAVMHGALYALTIPAWDLFDEEQHLSYALYLADEQLIPRVDDSIQVRILESAVATDRWSKFGIEAPVSLDPSQIGLEGLSYEGYQPPLYYALVAPITWLAPDDAWWELRLARLFGLFLILGFASICWGYARDWMRQAQPITWGLVVVISVAIPSVAASAGRVNNDLLVGAVLAAGVLMASRLLEDRRVDQAIFLGLLNSAAIISKGQGAVLLLVTIVALGILAHRRQGTPLIFAASLAPGILSLGAATIWNEVRYGHLTGASAFLDLVVPFEPLGPAGFVGEVWLNSWSSYWGAYDGGGLKWLTGIFLLLAMAAGLIGLFTGRNPWHRTPEGRQRLALTGTLVLGTLIALWIANDSGLAHPHGRMLLGVIPPVVTLTVAGFRRLAGETGVLQLGVAVVGLSAVFYVLWFVPLFY